MAHDISSGGIRAGIKYGIDGLAHTGYLDEELAREVFGTDGGVLLPHGRNAEEFLTLNRAGLSALDAIRAATVNAAAALGIQDSVGMVVPRMSADMIAVGGDPLADLSVLQNVKWVMLRGRVAR